MTVGIVLRIAEFVYWCPVIFFVASHALKGVLVLWHLCCIIVTRTFAETERCLITSASQLQEKHGQTKI